MAPGPIGSGPISSTPIAGALPKVEIHGPLPVDHKFYALVGRVASEWSHLEHILDATIWDLLPVNQMFAACVTSQIMGVRPRCNAIQTLGEANGLKKSDLKPFRRLANDSHSAGDWRNRFIHDPWYFEAGSEKPAQFRAMPPIDPRYGYQEVTQDEIDDTLTKIRELQERASTSRRAVRDALAALRENTE